MTGRARGHARRDPAALIALGRRLGEDLLDGKRPLDAAARAAVDDALGRKSIDLGLHAAALLLAFDARDDLGLHRSSARYWVFGLERLITSGHLDAAAYSAPRLVAAFPRITFLTSMSIALRRLPPAVETGRQPFRDDRRRDVQLVPIRGADTVIMAFTGADHKLGLSLNLMDRWLARCNSHVIYLRDRQKVGFSRGVPELGDDLPSTVAALLGLASNLGVRHIVTMGNSAGATAALRYAIPLGAERVLALAPITGGPEHAATIAPHLQSGQVNPWEDLVPLYRDATGVRALVVYGALNEGDRQQSLRMEGLPGVTVESIKDWDAHHLIGGLLRDGQLPRVLRWLTSPDGVLEDPSGRVLALSRS